MILEVTTEQLAEGAARNRRTPGGVIAVVGPDGVGKSTLCEALLREGIAGRPVLRFHSRPPMLPRRSANESVVRPHARPSLGRLASIAKLSYLYIDYLLGWLVQIRPFVKRGGCVVLERGWWDMAVDPARYRLDIPNGLALALSRLLPAVDLVLVLEAPSNVLLERKAELPADELARQMRAWREVLPENSARVYIDASLAASEVTESALREVRRALAL